MNARGFALLEWLVASAFVLTLAGALFATVTPVRDTLTRTQHAVDLAAGARAALDLVVADVRQARSNGAIAPPGVMAASVVPSVLLLRDLASGILTQPAGAITIRRVPLRAAQARLGSAVSAGDTALPLDTSARCATGQPACGFRSGDHAVLFTGAVGEIITIETEFADSVVLQAPISHAYPAGAILCRIVSTTYGLRQVAGAADQLVRLTDGGAEQPVLDDVVGFEITADDDDPRAMRRVTLRLRVEAAPAYLRGPAGYFFARAGTATSARRWLPDVELRTDVALRNGGLP
jgi:hypothetical protein